MSDIDFDRDPTILAYRVDLIKDAAEAAEDGSGADMELLAERVGLAGVYELMLLLAAALSDKVIELEMAELELADRPEPEPSPLQDAIDTAVRLRETEDA